MLYLVIYLLIINLISFITYGLDKLKAKAGKWRISEKTLLGFALIGGSLGALIGMQVFRHKTKHIKFQILVPLFLLFHTGIIIYSLIKIC